MLYVLGAEHKSRCEAIYTQHNIGVDTEPAAEVLPVDDMMILSTEGYVENQSPLFSRVTEQAVQMQECSSINLRYHLTTRDEGSLESGAASIPVEYSHRRSL